ncbi:UrcA family protein [Phenylobacterium sp.]|jgi:UrcA family protein|uniref:UrcA family protein n=1 Tax=Phenylobacterium sp. TaxID=1871053 RepID=UPI002F3F25D4
MKSPAKYGFAGFAAVVLASLPVAVLSTAAHAAERVQVSDLNMSSAAGQAAFSARVDQAARHFCRSERDLNARAACQVGIRQEAAEKASTSLQMASRI